MPRMLEARPHSASLPIEEQGTPKAIKARLFCGEAARYSSDLR